MMKVRSGVIAFLGLAIWWLLILSLWTGWFAPSLVFAPVIVLVFISLRLRGHPQIVSVWMPAIVFAGLSTLAAFLIVLIALTVLVGYHAQSLFGALSAGVFVLMTIPIGGGGILVAGIFFLLLKYRPKNFPQPLSSLATLNTFALCVFIAIYHQTIFISARDPMIVHVLDSQDRPISSVTIQYANYTTMATGGTEPSPEESGTLTTDDTGTVKFSPNWLARHVVLDLSKSGYGKIKATIVNDDVGMGDQGYRVIHVQLNGQQGDAFQTYVSNKHPIEIKLYLPTDSECPSPERQLPFGGAWPSSGELYLRLSDGTISESPGGDLKFQIVDELVPNRPTKHFRVTALKGASLTPYHSPRADSAQGIRNQSLKFDDMMSLAPQDQYTDNLMIDWLNEFYYRSQDGKQYARVEMSDLGGYQQPHQGGPKGKIFLWTMTSH